MPVYNTKFSHAEKILLKEKTGQHKKKLIQLMTITELVLLILNFTLCIVCLWLSLLKQKLNTTRSMCNVERAPYYIAIQLQLRPIN